MFQQTFVPTSDSHRKPYSLGLSLLLQGAGIAALAIAPLFYNAGLPSLQLRTLLVAPAPPRVAVTRTNIIPAARVPTSHRFVFHPDTVDRLARRPAPEVDVAPLPGVDIGGVSTDPNASAALILGATEAPAVQPPVPKPPAPKVAEPKIARVGSGVAEANLIHRVQPIYPPIARSARVSGTVEFSATISRDGAIENLQLLRGHPLLVAAARQAILQWRYKPTLLNGVPVEVVTSIIVTFTLN